MNLIKLTSNPILIDMKFEDIRVEKSKTFRVPLLGVELTLGKGIDKIGNKISHLDRSDKTLKQYNESKGLEHEVIPVQGGYVFDSPYNPELRRLVEEKGCTGLIHYEGMNWIRLITITPPRGVPIRKTY